MNAAEAALMAKWRDGHAITQLDHIPTIETIEELDGFKEGLKRNGRMTQELLTAIYRHETRLRAGTSR